ncbi:MAG: hypothetical protein J0L62_09935 [Bacteroidetes bacterium]|nr:hypothetical protein [Bacteroidota bacterium]
MYISVDNKSIGRIKAIHSYASQGLNTGILSFEIEIDFNFQYNPEIIDSYHYELKNCIPFCFLKTQTTNPILIGQGVIDKFPVISNYYLNGHRITFHLPLTFSQLNALEEKRSGGIVVFEISFRFDFAIKKTASSSDNTSFQHLEGMVLKNNDLNSSTLSFTFNQTDWLGKLKHMAYTDFLLLEAKIPFAQKGSVLEKIKKEFQRARDSFQNGEFTTSVGQCRNVLEGLEELLQFEKRSDSNTLKDRNLTKAQRFDSFFSGLKKITHLSHHKSEDENEIYTEFNRQEAMTILGTTLLLLEHASQNMKSNEVAE